MRVIGGTWRGRRLRAPAGDAVRPTTDRVKEAVFNILGHDLEGAVCLDLCCGSGALGIEALSRGAARSLFVDRAASSLAAVRHNLDACGADLGTYDVINAEVGGWFGTWEPPEESGAWLVVADPPYRDPLARAIMDRIDTLAVHAGFRGATVEFGRRSPVEPATDDDPWQLRRYGESMVAVLRP